MQEKLLKMLMMLDSLIKPSWAIFLQVRKILYQLFELCPTPEAAIEADIAVVESIIKPLGLFRKRAVMFKRFSREYIEKQVCSIGGAYIIMVHTSV